MEKHFKRKSGGGGGGGCHLWMTPELSRPIYFLFVAADGPFRSSPSN